MFEFWFLKDEPHHGTTHDFLEVMSQIAIHFNPEIAGVFLIDFLTEHKKKLTFLRVTDWKFDYAMANGDTIKLHKHV